MTRRASAVEAEREIVRHCHSGLDVGPLQSQLLRSLRRLIPLDAAFFAAADPETLLFTGAYAEEPLDAATPLFLANEFGDDDVNKFTSLANSAQHVATLDGASRGDRPVLTPPTHRQGLPGSRSHLLDPSTVPDHHRSSSTQSP